MSLPRDFLIIMVILSGQIILLTRFIRKFELMYLRQWQRPGRDGYLASV